MPDSSDDDTQADGRLGIAAELAAAGFDDAAEIGRGGFGVVYRCLEISLGRPVAVKVLGHDVHGDERDRFVREQRALGALSGHPHVVPIFQAEITGSGRPYIVMPFHSRGSLQGILAAAGPLGWSEVAAVGAKIADALDVAHNAGIVHRDVKPANILLTDYGEPQLGDFGIARVSGGFETDSGRFAGTPAFTAPEVLKGDPATPAADLYSLAATLFCLVTGHAAFERRTGETVVAQFLRIVNDPVPGLTQQAIPPPLAAAIEQGMAADPAARPPSAGAFAARLRQITATGDESALAAVPPAVSTRFRPPTPPRPLVERPRVLTALRNGMPRLLTVIHGPAGFGKSTVAAQWGRALEADGIDVAWLGVESEDENVAWFLAHLIRALRRVRPGLVPEWETMLDEPSPGAVRQAGTLLIDQVHESGRVLTVIVDDWHRVGERGGEAADALAYLLEHACHHLRVVVTSRNRIGLPLSTMRVRDEVVEVDADDLRFDVAEAREFLVDVKGLELTAGTVAQLQKSTDGWAAALQLASLTLRRRGSAGDVIGHLAGGEDSLNEYLADNVLDMLPEPIVDFLLTTSLTYKTCAGLASALSGVEHGRRMLERIVDMDLFLQHLDQDREWYRYHPLFAKFLRESLLRKQPDRVPRLHATASAWFAEHHMIAEAVDHALAAGNAERAVDLVAEHAPELIEGSHMAAFLGLVAKLPADVATANPRLQLQAAWANLGLQRPTQTKDALSHVETVLRTAPQSRETTALLVQAAMVRTAATFVTDQFDGLPEIVVAHQHDFDGDPAFATAAAVLASIDAYYRYDFAAARRLQDWTAPVPAPVRSSGPFGVMYGYCMAGLAAYEQLDVAGAESNFRAALDVARTTGQRSHAARLSGSLLGALLYHTGRTEEADALLAAGVEIGPEGGTVEFLFAMYGTGARAKARQGDRDAAAARLDEGTTVARRQNLPRLGARIVNERVRLGLPLDYVDRDQLTALPPYRAEPNGIHASTAELRQDSAIRLLLAADTPAAAREALSRAERMVDAIAPQARPRALLHAQLLRLACLTATGQTRTAAIELAPILAECAAHHLTRYVTDADPHLTPALRVLSQSPNLAPTTPHSFLQETLTTPPPPTGR